MTERVEETPVEPDHTVDNRNVGCASGIARVKRALDDLPDGTVLEILSTDRRAKTEFPALAERTPHEILDVRTERRGLLRRQYRLSLRLRKPDEGTDR